MKNFFIVANQANVDATLAAENIISFLKSHGADRADFYVKHNENDEQSEYRYTDPQVVPKDTEVIIVLGGDGTLLQTARDLVNLEIPLIGINFGNLGFLSEIDKEKLDETLERLIRDDYSIESRMLLVGNVYRDNKCISEEIAFNDIVLNRCGSLGIIDFRVSVNEQYLSAYRADGIIISTPTGSTAYNMSAGGPIVNPSARLMVLTPICPHTLNARSIIFGEDDEINIEIVPGKRRYSGTRIVSFDGDEEITLYDEDRIIIKKATKEVKIVKMNSISFLQVLRRKMEGNENS
ncbi:MAG: NAD(+) kinase [Lachnospiraceae bacterium]|nr:NAD(+) kinase [Lachnospiraceae bacterium]